MARNIQFPGHLDLMGLERALNDAEATALELKAIAASHGETVAQFELAANALPRLRLALDPFGMAPPPPGETLVGRGQAVIKAARVSVVIYRGPIVRPRPAQPKEPEPEAGDMSRRKQLLGGKS